MDILQSRRPDEARGRCRQCKKWMPIPLPEIRKKLVYLDQSFLSSAVDGTLNSSAALVLPKLLNAITQQRIDIVVSDLHSHETSAISEEHADKMKSIWEFANNLAHGSIANDWRGIFVAQHRRMLCGSESENLFPITDIGIEDPHRLLVGMRVQLTNTWRPRFYRSNAISRDEFNEKERLALEKRAEDIQRYPELSCPDYIRKLWRNYITQGLTAWKQLRDIQVLMVKFIDASEAGRMDSLPQIPQHQDSVFRQIVGEVLAGLDEMATFDRWAALLSSNTIGSCPSLLIRIACEAHLLDTWLKGVRRNPNKFNGYFGLSRQRDIDHVSAFVPYMDVLTTDRDMHSLCNADVVARELAHFPCKIFSSKNYEEFEAWLDQQLV
jgi:hypothetical protein